MGARLLRPASALKSSKWGPELHYLGHVFRLGPLPGLDQINLQSVTPVEANLLAQGVLDANCVSDV